MINEKHSTQSGYEHSEHSFIRRELYIRFVFLLNPYNYICQFIYTYLSELILFKPTFRTARYVQYRFFRWCTKLTNLTMVPLSLQQRTVQRNTSWWREIASDGRHIPTQTENDKTDTRKWWHGFLLGQKKMCVYGPPTDPNFWPRP